jgi:hypothetical protein
MYKVWAARSTSNQSMQKIMPRRDEVLIKIYAVIEPVNDRVYYFEQITEAHEYVEIGHGKGNVAITVNKKPRIER